MQEDKYFIALAYIGLAVLTTLQIILIGYGKDYYFITALSLGLVWLNFVLVKNYFTWKK